MREIFQLPIVNENNLRNIEECLKALQALFEAQAFTLEEDDTVLFFKSEDVQTKAADLRDKISVLTKKDYSLYRLKSFISEEPIDKLAIILVQPKPPAVFDITQEEVVQLLEVIKVNAAQDGAGIYYLELLKNSLLLANVQAYIFNPTAHGLAENSTLAEMATKIIDDGREGSAILVF